MTLGRLVGLLTEHQFLSGQELAVQLGVTRAAVWKQVETLRGLGYEIEAYPRQGYRLLSRPDRLYPGRLPKGSGPNCSVKRSSIMMNYPPPTSGRKSCWFLVPKERLFWRRARPRAGAGWAGGGSHRPNGIWMSLILRPQLPPAQLSKLT